ncbi:glycerophosphodiester phosphodiesterase family protein [Mycoplasmatota bacterium WC30]
MNTIKIDKYFKGMVANRGLSGIETENTIFAFLAASNRSYHGISCDLNVSRDSKIILTYDDTLLRLGLLNLYIPSFTYDELKKFSLVDRKTSNLDSNLFIPKLSDFLSVCKAYRKTAFLNLITGLKTDNLDKIVEEANDFYDIKKTMFVSSNKKHLIYLTKKVDRNHLFLDVEKTSEEVFDFCKNNGFNANISYNNVSKEFVKRMHLIGLKVSTGVVNDKDVAEKLIKHDVDYVFTDILE